MTNTAHLFSLKTHFELSISLLGNPRKLVVLFLFLISFILAVLDLRCWAGFSLVAVSGSYSVGAALGFSLQWLLLLWSMGSRALGVSSCSMWTQ